MKIFVTGQWDSREEIQQIYNVLINEGHTITHDWTVSDGIGSPEDNRHEAGKRAAKDLDGVLAADAYIYCSNHLTPGRGMYVELGAALAAQKLTGKPQVYLVGKLNFPSVFYFHPQVQLHKTLDDLLPILSKVT
jgi:hypothetical protein